MKLTPQEIEKLEAANLGNIVRKAADGKPLTPAELEMIRERAGKEKRAQGRPPGLWPTFHTRAQASAAGIPLALLKAANTGCPEAFRSGRVYTEPLARWGFNLLLRYLQSPSQPIDNAELIDLKTEQALLAREQRIKVALKNAESMAHLIPHELCSEIVGRYGSQIRQSLQDLAQRAASEANPTDPERAARAIQGRVEEILVAITTFIDTWRVEQILRGESGEAPQVDAVENVEELQSNETI